MLESLPCESSPLFCLQECINKAMFHQGHFSIRVHLGQYVQLAAAVCIWKTLPSKTYKISSKCSAWVQEKILRPAEQFVTLHYVKSNAEPQRKHGLLSLLLHPTVGTFNRSFKHQNFATCCFVFNCSKRRALERFFRLRLHQYRLQMMEVNNQKLLSM